MAPDCCIAQAAGACPWGRSSPPVPRNDRCVETRSSGVRDAALTPLIDSSEVSRLCPRHRLALPPWCQGCVPDTTTPREKPFLPRPIKPSLRAKRSNLSGRPPGAGPEIAPSLLFRPRGLLPISGRAGFIPRRAFRMRPWDCSSARGRPRCSGDRCRCRCTWRPPEHPPASGGGLGTGPGKGPPGGRPPRRPSSFRSGLLAPARPPPTPGRSGPR